MTRGSELLGVVQVNAKNQFSFFVLKVQSFSLSLSVSKGCIKVWTTTLHNLSNSLHSHLFTHFYQPMCSEPPHTVETTSTPTLPLSSLPPEPPWMPTPPRLTLASVPFLWEEAPGKPRPSPASELLWRVPALRELPPPPRLLNEAKQSTLPSPTTVLDGPERAGDGSKRWGSFRMFKDFVGGNGNDPSATGVDGGGGSGRFRRKRTSSLSVSSYARSHFLVSPSISNFFFKIYFIFILLFINFFNIFT